MTSGLGLRGEMSVLCCIYIDGIFGLFIVFKKYSILTVTFYTQKFIRIQIRTRTYE